MEGFEEYVYNGAANTSFNPLPAGLGWKARCNLTTMIA